MLKNYTEGEIKKQSANKAAPTSSSKNQSSVLRMSNRSKGKGTDKRSDRGRHEVLQK